MTYVVTKNDEIIARFGRITVGHAGELDCRKEFGGRVELCLAPGQWDNYFWEPHEDSD